MKGPAEGEGDSQGNTEMNGLRHMPVMMLAAVLCQSAVAPLHADVTARYDAVFSDGSRLTGERMTGWDEHPGSPRLDETALFDARRSLRWLRDRSLGPWRMPRAGCAYVEFVGGDRLVGQVTGCRPSSEAEGVHAPGHLLVVPAESLLPGQPTQPTSVRVVIDGIRRIVTVPTPGRQRYRPGTLLYRDGRRVDFVAVRPGDNSLRFLLTDGTVDVTLGDIAEVHFPRTDACGAYFRALGVLSPACRSRTCAPGPDGRRRSTSAARTPGRATSGVPAPPPGAVS